jgi:hypothetical protein
MPSAPDELDATAHQIADLILERLDERAPVARTASTTSGQGAP